MSVSAEQLTQDLRGSVGEDYVFAGVFERMVYADTELPYDVEEADLPDVVVQSADAQRYQRY